MKFKFNFFEKAEDDFWFGLSQIIFRISFITFIVLFVVDYFLPGFVTNWFNPIYLLIIALVSGIMQFRIELWKRN